MTTLVPGTPKKLLTSVHHKLFKLPDPYFVNKNCGDLEMTNEFMRFLISNEELNEMASVKRLVTPTKELSLGSVYAPFSRVPADRTISPEVLGIKDPLTVQIRTAAFMVGKGELTIDQAIAMYGSFE